MARIGRFLADQPKDPLDRKVGFGQHAHRTWKWVCQNEPDYAMWFLSGKCDVPRSEQLEDALTEVMEARELFPDWRMDNTEHDDDDY